MAWAPSAAHRSFACSIALLLLCLAGSTAEEDAPEHAVDDDSLNYDALELARGPFITLALASPRQQLRGFVHEQRWDLRRTARTGEVAASASPFAFHSSNPGSTRSSRWKLSQDHLQDQGVKSLSGSADDSLLLSIWHRGSSADRLGASARRETMDTALVVHDRSFSMFKPAGDVSYCSSVHGPHCPHLRDRFAQDAELTDLVNLIAGQPEMDWWSSGAKDRHAAFEKIIKSANNDGGVSVRDSATQDIRNAVLQKGRKRQRSNTVLLAETMNEPGHNEMKESITHKHGSAQNSRDASALHNSQHAKAVRNSEARQVAAGDIPPVVAGAIPSAIAVEQRAVLRADSSQKQLPHAKMRQMATAQCCLLVDHIRSERCAPCRRYYAVPWLQVHNATSRISGHTTYRLMLDLIEKRAANIYTIYGDKLAPLILPDKHVFNEPLPMGANIGGVWPAFRNLSHGAAQDSYLTVGPVAGNPPGLGLGSVGIDFANWGRSSGQAQLTQQRRWFDTEINPDESSSLGIVSDDAAVFWMKPDAAPRAADRRSVTVAQLTLPSQQRWIVVMNAQGREQHYDGEDTADWVERNLTWAHFGDSLLGAA